MNRRGKRLWGCLVLGLALAAFGPAAPVRAADLRFKITPWPPYVGPDLPDMGATGLVVGEALKRAGLGFVPIFDDARTLAESLRVYDIDGIFPVYDSPARREVCFMSRQIGSSPLGLAQRAGHTLAWDELADLVPYTIGVVGNYANTESFDAMVASGVLTVVRAATDVENLENLLDGRVDLAMIDRNVMEWLLREDPALAGNLNAVHFNERPVAERSLHVCFRRDDRGRAARDTLNEALAAVDGPRLTAEWFKRMVTGR